MIISAKTYKVNEARYGGYDYYEHILTNEHDDELSISWIDGTWYVVTWTGETMHIDRFPSMDQRLWRNIYANWRDKCSKLHKPGICGLDWGFIDRFFENL